MTLANFNPPTPARPGEPVWEIAQLFPQQGDWTEDQYLRLSTNRLVEFDNGMIEVLGVPTLAHQLIVLFLLKLLEEFVGSRGVVVVAPYPLRVPSGRYREPDVLYMGPEQRPALDSPFTRAAELVVEVVSSNDPNRDYVTKRRDYAEAGVPEYWIVDPSAGQILVLNLEGGTYVEHGQFKRGQRATSNRLPGFDVSVDEVMSKGQ
jgi:Uma2 family endonuclease